MFPVYMILKLNELGNSTREFQRQNNVHVASNNQPFKVQVPGPRIPDSSDSIR